MREAANALIRRFDKALWKLAHEYAFACRETADAQDLYQEGVLAVLEHFKKADSPEEVFYFPTMSVRYAMRCYVLAQQVVRLPRVTRKYFHYATKTRRATEENFPMRVDPVGEEDWIAAIDFEDFLLNLPEPMRETLYARMRGESNQEIARRMGVTPAAITNRVKRTLRSYLDRSA